MDTPGGAGCRKGGAAGTSTRIQFVKSETLYMEKGREDVNNEAPKIPSLMTQPFPVSYGKPMCGRSGMGGGDPQFDQEKNGHGCGSSGIYRLSRGYCDGGPNAYKMPGSVHLNSKGPPSSLPTTDKGCVPPAQLVVRKEEYSKLLREETDSELKKFRKLAYEVVNLKSERPNATDKVHSASNRVPIQVDFTIDPVPAAKGSNSFVCRVMLDGIDLASGQGAKRKDAKLNAYEASLQKVLMPHLRIIQVDPERRQLQASREPFKFPPPAPSKTPINKLIKNIFPGHFKESNLRDAGIKRRLGEVKSLEEFVIVEPKIPIPDCTPAHTLRRSADFNHMLLEHEYFFKGDNTVRCVLKIENQVIADMNGISKIAAKNNSSALALEKLKQICWIIKTKQATDTEEGNRISKEEMLNELTEQSDIINNDNVGNKLLRKMGWTGGGVGKDGSGIAEPVFLKSVLNREGLGLSATKGITDEFRKRVREVIENYASSDNQEDLVFNCDFRLDERQIIHDECRRLNLKSKSRGKGEKRYLCVRRKRTANQLFNHIMSCGGETHRYQLVPPSRGALPPSTAAVGGQIVDSCLPVVENTYNFLGFGAQTVWNNHAGLSPQNTGNMFLHGRSQNDFGSHFQRRNHSNFGLGSKAFSGSFQSDFGNCFPGTVQDTCGHHFPARGEKNMKSSFQDNDYSSCGRGMSMEGLRGARMQDKGPGPSMQSNFMGQGWIGMGEMNDMGYGQTKGGYTRQSDQNHRWQNSKGNFMQQNAWN